MLLNQIMGICCGPLEFFSLGGKCLFGPPYSALNGLKAIAEKGGGFIEKLFLIIIPMNIGTKYC